MLDQSDLNPAPLRTRQAGAASSNQWMLSAITLALSSLTLVGPSGCCSPKVQAPEQQVAAPATRSSSSTASLAVIQPQQPPKISLEHTLVLQPGPGAGKDAFAIKYGARPCVIPQPAHQVAELPVGAWTARGETCIMRSYLQFTELAQIPRSATVLSAKLSLTGVPSSLVGPQGNSTYPGSPYNDGPDHRNNCVVERLGGNWDASTLAFDNQPVNVSEGRTGIPASDTQWNYNAQADVTAMVRDMVADPSANFGFVLKMEKEAIYRYVVFANSDSKDASARPKLIVVYK